MSLYIFLLGLAVGSFLNVLIDRLSKGEQVLAGRSHCDYCKKTLRWFELIPLLSFIIQKGRCLRCHKKLPIQYPLVELVTGIGFVLIQGQALDARQGLALSVVFAALLVIFVSDLKYQIIPDSMVILGLIGVFLQGQAFDAPQGLAFWLSGSAAAFFFFLLFLLTRGRGMGFGDVKLVFLLGLLLGYPKIIIALYAAFLTGAILGIILILGRKKSLKSKISFGPFLILGTLIALVWGEKILNYWRLLL